MRWRSCLQLLTLNLSLNMSNELLKKHTPAVYKDFRQHDTHQEERGKLDTECTHGYWVKRCSFCKGIMGSDCKTNYDEGDKIKILYTDFDRLVCSFDLAQKIQELKVTQRSKLYWVYVSAHDVLSLRSYENVKVKGNIVASAFTVTELSRLFSKLPKGVMTPKLYQYIGENAHEPNRLARLFIKLKKENEKLDSRI